MRKLYFLWKCFVFTFILGMLALLGLYLYAYITPKMDIHGSNRIVMFDKDDNVFYENSSNTSWVSLSDVSQYAKDGIIATEDKNFYSHNGFDYLRIIKAMYNNIKTGELSQGASTISQQYIKNLFLTFDKIPQRNEVLYPLYPISKRFSTETNVTAKDFLCCNIWVMGLRKAAGRGLEAAPRFQN